MSTAAAATHTPAPMAPPAAKAGELMPRETGAIDTTPPAIIARMLQAGVDAPTMERMLAMQERWEANEAKKSYVAAMARAKVDAPTIVKDKHVAFQTSKGLTEYDHATIGNVVGLIVPWLAAHGFSHRWDTKQEPNKITVTCVVTHERGHSESVTLFAAHDDSGGKNSIQALISTKSYLERHTLTAATGLATRDQEDDDGRSGGAGDALIDEATAHTLQKMIDTTITNKQKLFDYLSSIAGKHITEVKAIPLKVYPDAIAAIENTRQRLAEKKTGAKS